MNAFRFSMLAIVLAGLLALTGVVSAQEDMPSPPATLPADFSPATEAATPAAQNAPAAGYAIQPYLFVPSDRQTNPFATHYLQRQLQNVRQWYAEQLNGQTFTLLPVEVIHGQRTRDGYFEGCFPPLMPCLQSLGAGYLARTLYGELDARGYTQAEDRLQVILFQGEGFGTAMGSPRRAVIGWGADNMFPDCLRLGCSNNVSTGGLAHEIGHALGFMYHNDPAYDPEALKSIMSAGFYDYPRVSWIDTAVYPERATLAGHPFMNSFIMLRNPGFENPGKGQCLGDWTVVVGAPACNSSEQRSGLQTLSFNGGGPYRLYQTFTAAPNVPYDLTGWARATVVPAGAHLKVFVRAMNDAGTVLQTTTLVDNTQPTDGWTRFGSSLSFPTGTTKAQVVLQSTLAGVTAWFDDLYLVQNNALPVQPLPAGLFDGDQVATTRPRLSWSWVSTAATFELQVAADSGFGTLLAQTVTGEQTWQVPVDLPLNTRAYWRVRALNGAGSGPWSPVFSILPVAPGDYMSDEFDGGLSPAWSVVRPDAANYGIGPWGARNRLWINVQPGELYPANTAKNLVLRDAPAGDFQVTTLALFNREMRMDYQQGGLLIYQDDDNYVKLAHTFRDNYVLEFEAEVNGQLVQRANIYNFDAGLVLKLLRKGSNYEAWYSYDGVNFSQLGTAITANWSHPKFGAAAFGGSPTTDNYQWAFEWIRAQPLPASTPGDPYEPNDAVAQATPIVYGQTINATLHETPLAEYDVDYYKFSGKAGDRIIARMKDDFDGELVLYGRDGVTQMASNDCIDSTCTDEMVQAILPADGTYYLKAKPWVDETGHLTGAYTLIVDKAEFVSTLVSGTVDGQPFDKNDILLHYEVADKWEVFLDMSDVGITKNVGSFAVVPRNSGMFVALSFQYDQTIAHLRDWNLNDLGSTVIKPADVVAFYADSVGPKTAGSFLWLFDGSDVGLTLAGEKIDALTVAPDGRLLISTVALATVPGLAAANDEDLLAFRPTGWGSATAGTWSLHFDGSTVKGMGAEDLNGADTGLNGDVQALMLDGYTVAGVTCGPTCILTIHPDKTAAKFWDGKAHRFNFKLDGFDLPGSAHLLEP